MNQSTVVVTESDTFNYSPSFFGPNARREVSNGGRNRLSQKRHGEKSRLSIARALLQRADLTILDETFAALDPQNLELSIKSNGTGNQHDASHFGSPSGSKHGMAVAI